MSSKQKPSSTTDCNMHREEESEDEAMKQANLKDEQDTISLTMSKSSLPSSTICIDEAKKLPTRKQSLVCLLSGEYTDQEHSTSAILDPVYQLAVLDQLLLLPNSFYEFSSTNFHEIQSEYRPDNTSNRSKESGKPDLSQVSFSTDPLLHYLHQFICNYSESCLPIISLYDSIPLSATLGQPFDWITSMAASHFVHAFPVWMTGRILGLGLEEHTAAMSNDVVGWSQALETSRESLAESQTRVDSMQWLKDQVDEVILCVFTFSPISSALFLPINQSKIIRRGIEVIVI